MKRLLPALVLAALMVWGATRIFEAERLRPRVQDSLERALHRKVEVNGKLEYKWLTGPGFEVSDVVIHEDPRLGLEPLAYVGSLEATPRWWPLLRGRIEFSTLRLNAPSVNLMRTESGDMNFRPFLEGLFGARDFREELPAIEVRRGRVNFKQEHVKSVLYLTGADLDLRPVETGGFNISLGTEIARTDRSPAGYGSFSGQGFIRLLAEREPEMDLTIDLDRSALGDFLLLFHPRRLDVGGRISARARIAGPLSALKVDGRVDLEDFQRWSIPGFRPGAITVFYRGELDLAGQQLKIDSVRDSRNALPVNLRVRARDFFSKARWGAVAAAEDLPLAVVADFARATGFRALEAERVAGAASGALGISSRDAALRGGFVFAGEGFEGEFRVVPGEAQPLRLRLDAADFSAGSVRVRDAHLRAAGRENQWDVAFDCRSLTARQEFRNVRATAKIVAGPEGLTGRLTEFRAGEVAGTGELLPDNRFELTLASGAKVTGRQWPPDVTP
jgi:hypothetical protein